MKFFKWVEKVSMIEKGEIVWKFCSLMLGVLEIIEWYLFEEC